MKRNCKIFFCFLVLISFLIKIILIIIYFISLLYNYGFILLYLNNKKLFIFEKNKYFPTKSCNLILTIDTWIMNNSGIEFYFFLFPFHYIFSWFLNVFKAIIMCVKSHLHLKCLIIIKQKRIFEKNFVFLLCDKEV